MAREIIREIPMPKRKNTGLKEYWRGYRAASIIAYRYVTNFKGELLSRALQEESESYHKGLSDGIEALYDTLKIMEEKEKRLER